MITLIIPTFNRPHFLGRLLRYYQEMNFPYMIVIADSSPAPACEVNQSTLASLRDNLIIHYEPYRPDTYPHSKINQVLNTVDSKYVVICADDDFVVPSAITECIRFLELNQDYSVAHGLGLLHSLRRGTDSSLEHYWIPRYRASRSITHESPSQRLKDHLSHYTAMFYAVHRTETMQVAFRGAVEYTFDVRFSEVLSSALSVIHGKVKALPILYSSRESLPESAGQAVDPWPTLLVSDDFDEKCKQVTTCLSLHLQKQEGLSMKDADKIAMESLDTYLSRFRNRFVLETGYISSIDKYLNLFLQSPGKWPTPNPVRKAINRIRASLHQLEVRRAIKRYSPLLENEDSRFYPDFSRIRETVIGMPIGVQDND